MAFTDKAEYKIARHIVQPGGVNIQQISVNHTLTYKDAQYQRLDAQSGGLVVTLPEEKDGAMFVINCQGNSFTVKDAAANTIKVLSLGEGCMVCCDGSAWKLFL
jgi:hypothetical protein